jgi:hypothetical protein
LALGSKHMCPGPWRHYAGCSIERPAVCLAGSSDLEFRFPCVGVGVVEPDQSALRCRPVECSAVQCTSGSCRLVSFCLVSLHVSRSDEWVRMMSGSRYKCGVRSLEPLSCPASCGVSLETTQALDYEMLIVRLLSGLGLQLNSAGLRGSCE